VLSIRDIGFTEIVSGAKRDWREWHET